MELVFEKFQATGNDFIVLDDRSLANLDRSALAIKLCDRNFGVGSDGLIIARIISNDHLEMEFFNPDGTRDVCGNGLRAVALWRYRQKSFSALKVTINSEIVAVQRVSDSDNNLLFMTEIPIKERPQRATIVVEGHSYEGFYCDMGTPHFVIKSDSLPRDPEFRALSAEIENHSQLKDRVSVDWFVLEDKKAMVRIWERSCGETLSCGTGASAVALCMQLEMSCDIYEVNCKGGELKVSIGEKSVSLTGEARFVFSGKSEV